MYSIGLMSGTSMDGVDAALLETDGSANLLREIGHINISYDPRFKIILKATEYIVHYYAGNLGEAAARFTSTLSTYLQQCLQLSITAAQAKLADLQNYLQPLTLATVIQHSTYLHLLAVQELLKKTRYQAQQINVIGYHGQTLLHQPTRQLSLIVGDGQWLANNSGILVVANFRDNDIKAGGYGAPFAPLYHQSLAIRDRLLPTAVVNCGGIANISIINNDNIYDLMAFDTGPGNGLIDNLVRLRTQGRENMDQDGRYGLEGQVHIDVLNLLYTNSVKQLGYNYFTQRPAKALDIGDMQLIPELDKLSLADACATLEAFTADTIARSLDLIDGPIPTRWVLAGGGWYNPVICRELEQRLQKRIGSALKLMTADAVGWNSQALEAQIFAYLAVRSLQKLPLSVPGTTGVSQPVTGGVIYSP